MTTAPKKTIIRKRFDEHEGCPKRFVGKSRTKEAFKDDCDINNILLKHSRTGVAPINQQMPQYGEFHEAPDYQEALNVVRRSEEQFENLPSNIRDRFSNNPAKFLEFATDANNQEELIKMGLAKRRPVDPNKKEESQNSKRAAARKKPLPPAEEDEE